MCQFGLLKGFEWRGRHDGGGQIVFSVLVLKSRVLISIQLFTNISIIIVLA